VHWGLAYAIYCTSHPGIVESNKNRVGNLYLPISRQLATDLLESYDEITSNVLQKCFPLSEDYINLHWKGGVPVDKAAYLIKQISPEAENIAYLPGITVSMFLQKTQDSILKLTQNGKLTAHPALIEGEFYVEREELEEAWRGGKAKKKKGEATDPRELKSCRKLLGCVIVNYCQVNPHFQYEHLVRHIADIVSRLGLKCDKNTIRKHVSASLDLIAKTGGIKRNNKSFNRATFGNSVYPSSKEEPFHEGTQGNSEQKTREQT
jgi:hypothetical protein